MTDTELQAMLADALRRPRTGGAGVTEPIAVATPRLQGGFLAVAVLVTLQCIRFGWRAVDRGDWNEFLVSLALALLLWFAYVVRRMRFGAWVRDGLMYVRPGLRVRSWPVAEVGALVAVPIAARLPRPAGAGGGTDGIVLDRDGELLLRLRREAWTTERLARLADAVGVELVVADAPATVRAIDEVLPGYAAFPERHPGWTIAITLGVAAAILAAMLA